ncbi:hypothetical protein DFP72DRAFT_910480 [Ephemerocybe angulata]|uniref:Uncharacterized protein n=1 Tax=Ephemerocybe angulata TaxID=980116 RepID=A0A8H6M056_9AGAR|nr:hypothetical protein DFP72DRAFT_910480 [Tulosesus angulatus]
MASRVTIFFTFLRRQAAYFSASSLSEGISDDSPLSPIRSWVNPLKPRLWLKVVSSPTLFLIESSEAASSMVFKADNATLGAASTACSSPSGAGDRGGVLDGVTLDSSVGIDIVFHWACEQGCMSDRLTVESEGE